MSLNEVQKNSSSNLLPYAEIAENKRVINTELSAYNIILDRSRALWHIEPSKGPAPKLLSGEYTTPRDANIAIKNYLDVRDRKNSA